MRVCLDIQAAIDQRSGVGRYARKLAEHLSIERRPPDELALFGVRPRNRRDPGVRNVHARIATGPLQALLRKTSNRLGWPSYDRLAPKCDLYHFPDFVRLPLQEGRSIVTIHDLAFMRYPETLDQRNLEFLRARVRPSVQRSDAVIANSHAVADEILDAMPEARGKTVAIWPGIDHTFRDVTEQDAVHARNAYEIDGPYWLFVGTLEPRKNVPIVIETFERLRSFDGTLVLAGAAGWKHEPILARIRGSPRRERIRWLSFVDEQHLPGLYRGCEVFLFPSLYEGFGFPPLEALAAGAPVVASGGGSLREVLDESAVVVDSFEPESWVAAVQDALSDSRLRARLRGARDSRLQHFDWSRTARRTWDLYRSIVDARTDPAAYEGEAPR